MVLVGFAQFSLTFCRVWLKLTYSMKNNYRLLSFSVANYRSFCEEQKVDFTIGDKNPSVLAFYGANASGKSNLYAAMLDFFFLINSSTDPRLIKLPYRPFLLKQGKNQEPSSFTVTFEDNGENKKYRYSFSYNAENIVSEELYDITKTESGEKIFDRVDGKTAGSKKQFGAKVYDITRDNSLLITSARQFKNKFAMAVLGCVQSFSLINIGDHNLRNITVDTIQSKPHLKERVLEMLKKADFDIRDFSIKVDKLKTEQINSLPIDQRIKDDMLLNGVQNILFNTSHKIRNDNDEIAGEIIFEMGTQESFGTNFFFDIIVPIIDSIDNGKTLYIDEFGSGLHSDICAFIIKLFKDNNNGARLFINTHDTSLMRDVLDRDEILLVEKNNLERTVITPLRDKRTVRKDDNIESKYRFGVYGGKPFITQ